MGISTHKAVKNASIRGKKTHVYRVAGMIASIRGKIPHVYRVIILKQMAYHMLDPARLNAFSFYAPVYTCILRLLHGTLSLIQYNM